MSKVKKFKKINEPLFFIGSRNELINLWLSVRWRVGKWIFFILLFIIYFIIYFILILFLLKVWLYCAFTWIY